MKIKRSIPPDISEKHKASPYANQKKQTYQNLFSYNFTSTNLNTRLNEFADSFDHHVMEERMKSVD